MNIDLAEINSNTPAPIGLLVCSSSFEERWYQVAENISSSHLKKIKILQKSIETKQWNKGIDRINGLHGEITTIVHIEELLPAALWRAIANEVITEVELEPNLTLIDVTTFTHEVVLFFVALLVERNLCSKVIFAYAGAGEYFTSDEPSEKWLSRGVKDIRSVLGFPGEIRPSKKSHLIILVGFETERAKELIIQYEPSSISLGVGVEPYDGEFYAINNQHKQQLAEFIRSMESSKMTLSEFSFSCSDSLSAKESILKEANKFPNLNLTVAPMNTKISTIGAGLAAIENERLKLCYVEPAEYNKKNYSSPGKTATLIKI